MRFKNVFFYVDFFDANQTVFSYRSFVWSGKNGREWCSSSLSVGRSIEEIERTLRTQFRNKLRSIQLEFSPRVVAKNNCSIFKVVEL